MGAILIEGSKWCGKSTTRAHHSKSIIEFQNPDKKNEYEEIIKGSYILTGSAKPSEGEVMHTGTGRISRVLWVYMNQVIQLEKYLFLF